MLKLLKIDFFLQSVDFIGESSNLGILFGDSLVSELDLPPHNENIGFEGGPHNLLPCNLLLQHLPCLLVLGHGPMERLYRLLILLDLPRHQIQLFFHLFSRRFKAIQLLLQDCDSVGFLIELGGKLGELLGTLLDGLLKGQDRLA